MIGCAFTPTIWSSCSKMKMVVPFEFDLFWCAMLHAELTCIMHCAHVRAAPMLNGIIVELHSKKSPRVTVMQTFFPATPVGETKVSCGHHTIESGLLYYYNKARISQYAAPESMCCRKVWSLRYCKLSRIYLVSHCLALIHIWRMTVQIWRPNNITCI